MKSVRYEQTDMRLVDHANDILDVVDTSIRVIHRSFDYTRIIENVELNNVLILDRAQQEVSTRQQIRFE
jgi:hypothetical protein